MTAWACVAGIACACATGLSAATAKPLWEAGLGLGALRMPHYRGSDQAHRWLVPVPYLVYRGRIFRADREGARLLLFDSDRVDVDFSLAAAAPAQSRDNRARAGMADLPATVEFGPMANVLLARGGGWRLDLRLPVRSVFGIGSRPRTLGWSVSPALKLDAGSGGFEGSLQAGPLWGSGKLHRHFYGVAPAEATPSRPAYRAGAGAAGWQATATLSRTTPTGWVGLFARRDSVAGAAFEPSPLVRSRTQWSAGVAVSWILWRSGRPAVRDD